MLSPPGLQLPAGGCRLPRWLSMVCQHFLTTLTKTGQQLYNGFKAGQYQTANKLSKTCGGCLRLRLSACGWADPDFKPCWIKPNLETGRAPSTQPFRVCVWKWHRGRLSSVAGLVPWRGAKTCPFCVCLYWYTDVSSVQLQHGVSKN